MANRISCFSSSNFSSYQREKIRRRVTLVRASLSIASKHRMQFRYLKHLASYVAHYIEEIEFNESKDRALAIGLSHSDQPQKVDPGTFTRSSHYKPLLDEWMLLHSKGGSAIAGDKSLQNNLRVKITELSNELAHSKHELAKRESAQDGQGETLYTSKTKVNPDLTEAYFMVAALLEEFSDFVEVHDGALVVANSLRKVLIEKVRFKIYQEWRKGFIEMRRPKLH